MAKIEKRGKRVTLTMDIQEALLLQNFVEKSGNVAARARHFHGDNPLAKDKAESVMKAMWSLSDHLSVPDSDTVDYTQEFRLP